MKEKEDRRLAKMRKGEIAVKDAVMLVVLAAFAIGGYSAYRKHQRDVAQKERMALEEKRARREQAEREARERREREEARYAEEKAARARAEAERRAQEDAERARRKRKAEQEEAERRRLAADREKWREEFNVAREKFSASLLLATAAPADEKPGSVRLAKTFWCVFPSYDLDKRIFVIDAAPGGFMRVKSIMSDSGPEDVDAAVFKSRLSSEPYALTSGGNVWIGNVRAAGGVYDIPKRGENLCIMESCLKELYPVAVALGVQPPEVMFNVYLRKKDAKNANNDRYVGEVLYGEIVERSKLEDGISKALGAKTGPGVFKSKLKKPKFKQTVVLYDGLHIASGVDGVTKVPRTFKHLGTSHNDWKSYRTVEEFRRKWQNLHDEALRQERKMQEVLSEYESALAEEKAEWEAKQAAQKRRRAADAQDANVIDSVLGKYKLYIKAKQKGKTK